MPVGRYFRGLTAYDLLGNLVPGTIALVATMGFLPSPPIPTSLGDYGLFTVVAFSVGAIVQEYASKAVGERESFDKTMDSAEVLSSLQYREEDSESDENDTREGDAESKKQLVWQILHPFVGPVCGWRRPSRGKELDDAILANRIWTHLVDTYEIPFTTDSYSVLYHVMSSRIDDIRSPSRATRIQAIRNFHRGMWITSWYSLVLLVVAVIADASLHVGTEVPLFSVEYATPAYFDYWTPLWHLGVVAATGVVVFWLLLESTEEDYIEYLFADYAVSIGTESSTVTLAEDAEVAISGDLRTTLENDRTATAEGEGGDTDGERKAGTD